MSNSDGSNKRIAAGAGLAAAAFMSFFIFGFSDVLKGTAIPEIMSSSDIGYNAGGALIGFTYFGFFCGTLSSFFLLKKRPAPVLLIAAALSAFLGMILFGFAEQLYLMFISAFLIGVGGGLIDVTANLTVRMTADKAKLGARLNQLAFFHGIGAILSPLYAGVVLSVSADWHNIYRFAGGLVAVLIVLITVLVRTSHIKQAPEGRTGAVLKITPGVALLAVVLFFYMTLEAGISGWLVEYGRSVSGLGEQAALFYLSLFFILLTAGRFLSSFYVDKLGLHRSIILNFILIFMLTALGVIFENLFFLISCSGLFMAPIFPTTVALISNELGNSNIRILGVFFSVAGIGGIFGPWMIGMMAKSFSLQTGFALLMVFSICAITVCGLYKFVSARRVK